MDTLTCRLLPHTIADGPTNMATDEVLLQTAQQGLATLRFYSWSPPTLSLGYFQSEQTRHVDPRLAALPFVRRPSGGDTLVHHHELTYALSLPPGTWLQGEPWLVRMHKIIAAALGKFGVNSELYEPTDSPRFNGNLCFHHFTPGDLMAGGAKVVGSAQRKRRGALLQHGGILLRRSQHTPTLRGLLELIGQELNAVELATAIKTAFSLATGAILLEQPLTEAELCAIADLRANRYSTSAWNQKR